MKLDVILFHAHFCDDIPPCYTADTCETLTDPEGAHPHHQAPPTVATDTIDDSRHSTSLPVVRSRNELKRTRRLERHLGRRGRERSNFSAVTVTTNHEIGGALLPKQGVYVHPKPSLHNNVPRFVQRALVVVVVHLPIKRAVPAS